MTTLALPRLRVDYFLAISNQLNAAPYLQHKPWQLLREEDRASRTQLAILRVH